MHHGMPYGRNQSQGQGHSREVDRQSPTGLIFLIVLTFTTLQIRSFRVSWNARLKQKCSWHDLMMSILLVLNSFMKNLSTTKSNDLISDFFRGQASRPYIPSAIRFSNYTERTSLQLVLFQADDCFCRKPRVFADSYIRSFTEFQTAICAISRVP